MKPALAESVALFRELGWDRAPLGQVPDLPIGTPEQQRRARTGLQSGEWGHFGEIARGTFGWVSDVPVDAAMLGLFAIRVGVDARRAFAVAPSSHSADDRVLQRVVSARGPAFAGAFVEHASVRHPAMVVRIVVDDGLPVPEDLDYLESWARVTETALREGTEVHGPDRFADHARAAVAAGLGCTGPLATVFPEGVRRGWLGRDEAVTLAFSALDAAVRPGDRKAWARILTDDLALTDAEVAARADSLVAVLATGEAPLVEAFGVRLLGVVPDDLLADVLAAVLTARTKKALRAVLAAAAVRRPPAALVGELAPFLEPLVADGDKAVAAAARKVLDVWGAEAVVEVAAEVPVARGLWQPTPPLWEVPRFELGEVSADALTDLAAVLLKRPQGTTDVETDRFLALANEVARHDPAVARRALGGVPAAWVPGLRAVASWVAGEPSASDLQGHFDPLHARELAVVQHLGELPCLLSAPTWVDLRIDPADLLDRLRSYEAARVDVLEPDLLLALLRLDRTLVTPESGAALGRVKVAVRLPSGRKMRGRAGAHVQDYLLDPVVEPAVRRDARGQSWRADEVRTPASLRHFPPRLARLEWIGADGAALWAGWGDAAAAGIGAWPDASYGFAWRQLVRRAAPLTPGAAVNLLAAQRGGHPVAAPELARAALEAWQRGLLQPGVADVQYLDWQTRPANLAALAAALVELAEDGLASVVWPVLDDLLVASLAGTRLAAGTAEVADALRALAPEAVAAVDAGLADASALAVPGLRALAARPGSARAVTAARAALALLPEPAVAAASPGDNPPPPVPVVDLAAVWPEESGALPAVPDGVALTAQWEDPEAGTKMLAFDLVLPDVPGTVHRVVKGWTYDLENEGQCQARVGEATVYLYWDGRRLAVADHRDRVHRLPGPVRLSGPTPPLTTSMVAVAVGMVAQDGDRGRTGEHLLDQLVRTGRIGSAAVRTAMAQLLDQRDVSPARLVRVVEKRPHLLPTLWPLLTEPVRVAGLSDEAPPRWLNQVLTVAIAHAPTLRAAAAAGRLPADAAAWPGLAGLAARPGKSATLEKARSLQTLLS